MALLEIDWSEVVAFLHKYSLVTPVVIITMFIVERIIAGQIRTRDNDKAWYMQILVEPNVEKISSFYKSAMKSFQDAHELLIVNSDAKRLDYIELKAKQFEVFQDLKREFQNEVVFPIEIRYPEVGELLLQRLRDIEDSYTLKLDSETLSIDLLESFQSDLAENKGHFLNTLYSPLEKKRFWFLRFLLFVINRGLKPLVVWVYSRVSSRMR